MHRMMREALGNKLSMEQSVLGGGQVLSMEEEVVVLDEAVQDAAASGTELAEAERLLEVSQSLEDLAVIADTIEEATPAEVALVETVGDMAVAGTDIPAEEIVPSLESYRGKKLSMEAINIRETAKTIWEGLLRILKNIWSKIEGFFYKIFGTIPGLRKNLENIKKHAEEVTGTAGKEKLTIGSGVANLSVNYAPIKTAGELAAGVTDLITYGKAIYGTYVSELSKVAENIASHVSDFDPAKPEECSGKLVGALEKPVNGLFSALGSASSSNRYPGFDTKEYKQLLGNVVLVVKRNQNEGKSQIEKLEYLRTTRVELAPASSGKKEAKTSMEVMPFDASDVIKVCDDALKLLDVLEDYKRGSKASAIEKGRKDLEKASAKAEGKLAGLSKDEEQSAKAAVPHYRAMINMNLAFARWARDPMVPFLGHSLNVLRAVAMISTKSLNAYTK